MEIPRGDTDGSSQSRRNTALKTGIKSPASHGSVDLQSNGMSGTSRDNLNRAKVGRNIALPVLVVTPRPNDAIGLQADGMRITTNYQL
jgi:hypothetical protein